jgi:hypothetical protein
MTDEYLDWIWYTRDNIELLVRDMSRSHVRNSLQWCIQRQANQSYQRRPRDIFDVFGTIGDKDGRFFDEWITAFTIRLLDPALGE